jgi:uncharacterized membrane-anchored protein
MDTAVLVATALAFAVGHSAHASQYHLLVDSALGIGAGFALVIAYVLVLRWRSGRDGGKRGDRQGNSGPE